MTEEARERRPFYNKALKALEAAHKACFDHPERGVLGMSHGPFSGVNEALGIISMLETRLARAERRAALVAEFVLESMQSEPPQWAKDPWNGDSVCRCGDCGAWMLGVRPSDVQCDVCDYLEEAAALRNRARQVGQAV